MLDFLRIETEYTKTGTIVTPNFIVKKSKDLMIRGGDFYAIWDEAAGKWSRDEDDVIRLIDAQTDEYVANNKISSKVLNQKYSICGIQNLRLLMLGISIVKNR